MLHKIVKMKEGWYIKVPYFFNKIDMARNRFDPVTMGIAMMAGGTALEMSSTLKEGKAAAKAGEYEQLMLNRQGKGVQMSGLDDIRRLREEGKRILEGLIVNAGAGGGTLTGTILKAAVNTAANVEADAAVIGRNASFQADSLRYQGSVARYEGRMARYASRIRAATTLGKNVGSYLLMAGIPGGKQPTTELGLGKGGGVGSLQGRNLPKTYGSLLKTRPWAGLNVNQTLYGGGFANA